MNSNVSGGPLDATYHPPPCMTEMRCYWVVLLNGVSYQYYWMDEKWRLSDVAMQQRIFRERRTPDTA